MKAPRRKSLNRIFYPKTPLLCFRTLFCLPFLAAALLLPLAAPAETIRVGSYQNPPKIFTTPEGEVTGIFPETLSLVAKERNWDIEYIQGSWSECLERLENGKIDLLMDIAFSQKREQIFNFSSEPLLSNWGIIYAQTESNINSINDMNHKTIAVMKDSIHTEGNNGIKALSKRLNFECNYIEVESYREVLTLIDSKQADAGIVNRIYGSLYASKYKVIPTPIIFNPRLILFAAKKNSEKGQRLLDQIDNSIRQYKNDFASPFHQILAYYLAGGQHVLRGICFHTYGKLKLSTSEEKWIKDHPLINFGIDKNFAPFELISKSGEYSGIASGYLNLIENMTGLKFNLVQCETWSDNINAIKTHNIDLLPCVGINPTRQEFMSFSEPYLKFSRVIVTKIDSPLHNLKELKNKKIGVQKESSHHIFLVENTKIEPELFTTFQDAMLALSNSKLDAVVGNLAVVTHVMQNLALTNLKLTAHLQSTPEELHFGVRKDWPILTDILNRTLDSITLKQSSQIQKKWISIPVEAGKCLDLTAEERKWLLAHPRIRVGWDSAWAPIEYADKKSAPLGISINYLKAIQKKLGVHFDMGSAISWQEVNTKSLNRELDILSCVAVSAERMKHFNFTDAYLDIPIVIFGRKDMPYIRSISDMKDLRVAVIQDYATDHWISHDFPKLNLIRAKNITEAFKLLKHNKIDAFVGNVVVGNYHLSRTRNNSIKIVGETPYAHQQCIAVRKDWPILVGILQKAINSIPESDKTAFYRKWVWLNYEYGFNYYLFSKIVMGILVFVLMLLFWNRRLSAEIKQRITAESSLLKSEQELSKSYSDLKRMETLKDNLTNMVVHDMRTPLTAITCILSLLDEDLTADNSNSQIQRNLLIGKCSTGELTRMIQSLLDITRFESQEMPINLENTDLKEIAKKAIQSTQIQADYAEQKLIISGDSVLAQMDSTIIHRVFTNIIVNAIKASSNGATIKITISDNSTDVIATVRDHGNGIPEEFLHNIFEKFTSAETGNKRKPTSIGLGLAFCKMAIEAHGGEISVKTKTGEGSTFSFKLPKVPAN